MQEHWDLKHRLTFLEHATHLINDLSTVKHSLTTPRAIIGRVDLILLEVIYVSSISICTLD